MYLSKIHFFKDYTFIIIYLFKNYLINERHTGVANLAVFPIVIKKLSPGSWKLVQFSPAIKLAIAKTVQMID